MITFFCLFLLLLFYLFIMEDYGNSDDEHQYLDDDEVDIDDNGYGFEAPATENMARASASSMV